MKRLSLMRKLAVFLFVIMLSLLFLTACTHNKSGDELNNPTSDNKGEETMILTERQKNILTQEGLPANYDELSLTQKSAISAIENMLDYIENKYNIRFEYSGYVAAGSLEKEHLEAYPADQSSRDVVTVYREYVDGEYVYSDNYYLLEANSLYQNKVDSFFAAFSDIECKAFTSVTNANEEMISNNVISASSAATYVFINEDRCAEESFSEIVNKYSEWISKEAEGKASSSTTFLRINNDEYSEITKYNYSARVYEVTESLKKTVIISSEGQVTIR